MKLAFLILASCALYGADDLNFGGIAHVGFRVPDLDRTRAFYSGQLGLEEAFEQKDASGKTDLVVFKINDDQFLEFAPGSPAGFTHVAFLTKTLEPLHARVASLGLNPPNIRTGRDRTHNFSIKDPDGHRIEFVQYEPDSLQAQGRGKFISNRRKISHIDQVSLPVADRQAAGSFLGKFGLAHLLDTIELVSANVQVLLWVDGARDARDPDGLVIRVLPRQQ